jgi:hypothetical protein
MHSNVQIQKYSFGILSKGDQNVFLLRILGVNLSSFEKIDCLCVHLLFGGMFIYNHLRVDNVWGMHE